LRFYGAGVLITIPRIQHNRKEISEMKEEIFVRQPFKTKEEWLGLRQIGGSDASAILGFNPYKNNLELWRNKVEVTASRSNKDLEKDNFYIRYGIACEPALRYIFAWDYYGLMQVYHNPNEILYRKDKPYLTATLDGELEVLESFEFTSYWKSHYNKKDNDDNILSPQPFILKKGMRGVLEIKTTEVLSSMHKEKWHNSIPQNYYIQTLHYLNVTGYDFVILVAQLKFVDKFGVMTKETRQYGFLRAGREADLAYLEAEEDKFWNEYVVKKVEPPLIIKL